MHKTLGAALSMAALLSLPAALGGVASAADFVQPGPCCTANGTPGCYDHAVTEQTCAKDPYCCANQWDSLCVKYAKTVLGACSGSCYEPHAQPECEDAQLNGEVCALDPYCCQVTWDGTCAKIAAQLQPPEVDPPTLPSICGDGVCSPDESCGSCGTDCCPCPALSAELCLDSEWLETTSCGQAVKAEWDAQGGGHYCSQVLLDELSASEAAHGSQLVVPPGGTAADAVMAVDLGDPVTASGADIGFYDYGSPTFWYLPWIAESNGQNLRPSATCAEATYEAFIEFNLFEQRAHQLAGDPRAVVDLAFGPDQSFCPFDSPSISRAPAIGTRIINGGTLRSRSCFTASPAQPTIGGGVRPKNGFYDVGPAVEARLKDEVVCTWSEAVAGECQVQLPWPPPPTPTYTLMGGGSGGLPHEDDAAHSFQWHADMNAALSGELDEWMNFLHREQSEFRALALRAETLLFQHGSAVARCEVQQLIDDYCGRFPGACPVDADPDFVLENHSADCDEGEIAQLEAQVDAVWAKLNTKLRQAHAWGCFEPGVTACDWSPRLFVEEIHGQLVSERRRYQKACEESLAGVDPAELASYTFYDVDGTPWGGAPQSYNYLHSTERLATFVDRRMSFMRHVIAAIAVELGSFDAEGDVKVAESFHKSDSLGNEWFGVGYAIDTDWQVYGFESALCNVDAQFHGTFEAGGTVLTHDVPLIDVDLAVDGLASGTKRFDVDLFGVDTPAYSAGPLVQAQYTLVDQPGQRWDTGDDFIWDDITTFPILGVPVSVDAGIVGSVGYDARVVLTNHLACDEDFGVRLNAQFRPWANVSGVLGVGVDYAVLEVGVKGRLTILDAAVPTSVDIGASAAYGNPDKIELSIGTEADLELHTLDGRLSLYAELLGQEAEKTLFTWNGLDKDYDLFDASITVQLPILQLACDHGLSCGQE